MAAFQFLRLLGVVLVLGFLLAAVVSIGNGHGTLAILSGACVAAGLCVAVLGDKGIDRSKAHVAQKLKESALAFKGSEFTAGLRWIRTSIVVVVLPLLGGFCMTVAITGLTRGKYLVAGGMLITGGLLIASALSFLRTAYMAYRDGYLVRMDMFGLTLWGRPPIGWKLIEGIDLNVVEVKGQKQHQLILAIKPEYFLSYPSSRMTAWLHWTAPRPTASARTLLVPCALLNVDSSLLFQAAKVISDRYGSLRVKDWSHHIPIEVAIASRDMRADMEHATGEMDRLLSRMQALAKLPQADPREMRELEQKLDASFRKRSELNDAHFKVLGMQTQRMVEHAAKVKWAIVLVFALTIAAIVLKFIAALKH